MTLERLTERIQEEKDKIGKTDGRRFNSRSQTKMKWEIKNIEKSIRVARKRKNVSMIRGVYTKEELEEYKIEAEKFKKEMEPKIEAKMEAKMEAKIEPKIEPKMESKMEPKMESKTEESSSEK